MVRFELRNLLFELPHLALKEDFTLSLFLKSVHEGLHLHCFIIATFIKFLLEILVEGVALYNELRFELVESLPD
jgi:hypothetical protein